MIKNLFYILILCILGSCHPAKYNYSAESNNHGLEFREGKWLLNSLDCPADLYEELSAYCYSEFRKYLGDDLVKHSNAENLMDVNHIPLHPTPAKLQIIKNGPGFDYLIHIKINSISEDMQSMVIGSFDRPKLNKARVTMEIYDLNSPDVIYYQEIEGVVHIDRTNKDLFFTDSTNKITKKSLKKIFKKLENTQSTKT